MRSGQPFAALSGLLGLLLIGATGQGRGADTAIEALGVARLPQAAEAIAVARDGGTVVRGGRQPGWVTFVDGSSGKVRWSYRTRGERARSVSISADGSRVVLKEITGGVPRTELTEEVMVLLDGSGRALWARPSPGVVKISPSGEHLLAYDREIGFGLLVFRAADGQLRWRIPLRPAGGSIEEADFTADSRHILVRASGFVGLFTVHGQLVWGMDLPDGVRSAATSGDGGLTALLLSGNSRRLLLVNREGMMVAGLRLLQLAEFRPPPSEPGDWWEATVSEDGSVVILTGVRMGIPTLRAIDPTGRVVWNLTLPVPRGSSVSTRWVSAGLLAVLTTAHEGDRLQLIDGTGKLRAMMDLPARVQHWAVAPGGNYLSFADASSHLRSVAVSPDMARVPEPLRGLRTSVARASEKRWAWMGMRQAFASDHWHVRKVAKDRVVVTRRDRRQTVTINLGRRQVWCNGRRLSLPAAPRRVGNRIEIPSGLLAALMTPVPGSF